MAEAIQVNYEEIDKVISQIHTHAEQIDAVVKKVQFQTTALATSWRGEGAQQFQRDMEELVLPAFRRLSVSLEAAEDTLAKMKEVFLEAEKEAVRQLPGEMTAEGANGSRVQQTEAEATESRLNENCITIHSSGNCRDRSNATCTSVEDIREETVDGLIAFRDAVGVDLVVTGGTEVGHATGEFSHANGYKVDIGLNPSVDSYIEDNFEHIGQRSDGAELYRDDNGNIFAREGNHWDITFY